MLSGSALGRDCAVVVATMTTVMAAAGALAGAVVALVPLLLGVRGPGHGSGLWLTMGCVLLAVASALSCLTVGEGTERLAAAGTFGFVSGCGAVLTLLGLAGSWLRADAREVGVGVVVSIAAGTVEFLAFEALFSTGVPTLVSVALPCAVILARPGVTRWRCAKPVERDAPQANGAEGVFVGMWLAQTPLSDALENGLAPLYALLSGFLVGYVYNVYPKSTRLAGTGNGASCVLFEAVPLQVIVFYAVLLLALSLLLLVILRAGRATGKLLGGLAVTLFAASYFCLPLMEAGMFGLFMTSALVIALPVAGAIALTHWRGDQACALGWYCAFLVGQLLGALLCVISIEVTTLGIMPKIAQDALVVGPTTIALLAVSLVVYLVLGSLRGPGLPCVVGAPASDGVSLADVADRMAAEGMLSPRESEVLALLLAGRSGVYIADELGLSPSTVKTHVRHVYEKLGVSSKQQLIDLARVRR